MIRSLALAVTGLLSAAGFSAAASPHAKSDFTCPQLIANAEARRQIPHGLLMAIAITESGLDGTPNPFAMNIAGRSYHASGTREMASIIASNQKRGITSIDVGCMQINLKYHAENFRSYTELLDSATNVEYGASYLIKLAAEQGSWREGVMDYHNKRNSARRAWYGCKVWNNYLRITHARSGYIACPRTPSGSSVASNTSAASKTPLVIPGYNDRRQQIAQLNTANAVLISASANAPSYTQASHAANPIPFGNPLELEASAPLPNGSQEFIGGQPFNAPQPRDRVMGTIELADPTDSLGDITTSADPRASAFESVRPVDWSNRIESPSEPASNEPPTTSHAHGGFARFGPAAD